ncbi:sulfotransferase domain-containing protein [Ekhidna sp. MALMAid0563]|uniref:sulfotransferase domain-containing protein n=1 Tax=Ekhidna sp. MALMAid0563 TaxID=3143937 RepID=UPI0032DEF85A
MVGYLKNLISNSAFPSIDFKVNCFIVGAQKAGTSALFNYLLNHPEITGSTTKEVKYFSSDKLYSKGEKWYRRQFRYNPLKNAPSIAVDATPLYLYLPIVPERIEDYNSACKIIVMLRNPIDRAYSHWNMFRQFYSEKNAKNRPGILYANPNEKASISKLLSKSEFPSFREAIKEELELIKGEVDGFEPSWIRRGLYYDQLIRFHEFFNKEHILILDYNKFKTNTRGVLESVSRFLDISEFDWSKIDLSPKHSRTYNEKISIDDRLYLREFFHHPNEKLFNYLQEDYGWND